MSKAPEPPRPPAGVSPEVLARAEAALKSLSSQFGEWLQDELVKLEAARTAIRDRGADAETLDQLYVHAHDLKGLGTTYDFPLISRVAASLCTLLDGVRPRAATPLVLTDAHIDAIKAIVRDDIRDPAHAEGAALAQALEARVREVTTITR